MKLIVCEKCDAEYKILHNMNERYYITEYCTFCGEELSKDFEDEIEDWEDEDE